MSKIKQLSLLEPLFLSVKGAHESVSIHNGDRKEFLDRTWSRSLE